MPTEKTYARWGSAALLAAALIGLGGCHHGEDDKPAGQVVAKVNDDEITVSQLNRLLRETGADPSAAAPVRLALDSLIDQDLILQEALKSRMDRDPEVVQALDSARRRILADVYAERMIYPQTPITEAEEEEYYRKNPHLFTARKVYQVEMFSLNDSVADKDLRAELDQAHTAADVARILKQRNIAFEQQSVVRAAEQIPLEMLERFAAANPGDIIVAPRSDTHTVLMQIVETADKPLTFDQARPYIHQFLLTTRNRQALQERVKALREKSKVVYLGNFATDQAGAAKAQEKSARADDTGYLEKGLSGLK